MKVFSRLNLSAGYTEEQWKELDEKTKKEYIKNHPNSKYAKQEDNSGSKQSQVSQNIPSKEEKDRLWNSFDNKTKKTVQVGLQSLREGLKNPMSSMFSDDNLSYSDFGKFLNSKVFKDNAKDIARYMAEDLKSLNEKEVLKNYDKAFEERYNKGGFFDSLYDEAKEKGLSVKDLAKRNHNSVLKNLKRLQNRINKLVNQ